MDRKVTVVMPAYREKENQIKQAIESVLSQTMMDFEFVIILDDPSNTQFRELFEEYKKSDDRISVYVNEKNYGCPFSKDKGIRLAETEYVAIMDGDDVARPYRLEKQLNKIEEDRLDIVAGYVAVMDDEGRLLYNMDNLPLAHDKIVKKMKVNNCMPHPTWFLRRDVYLALNGYADMQGCEDYEFLIRAIRAGYKLGMVDDILLDYRLSSQSVSRNNLYKQYLMMNYIQDKYYRQKSLKCQSYAEYEKHNFNEKRAQRYAKAAVSFEKAIAAKASKNYISMMSYMIRSLTSSMEYAKKIVRYIWQEV